MPPKGWKRPKGRARAAEQAPTTESVDTSTGEITQESVAQPGIRDRTVSSRARAVIEQINKKMKGRGFIYAGSEMTPVFRLRRPTGIITMDLAIAGGIPAGGITEIIGKDGVGKSTISNLVLAQNQRIYGAKSCVFVASIESQWDKEHARNCGVRVAYSAKEIAELEETSGVEFSATVKKSMMEDQVGETYEPRGSTAEAILEEVIEISRSNIFQVGVIDSIGALLPQAVEEKTMADKSYGGSAGILTQFCQKWWGLQGLADEKQEFNKTSLILINQYRMDIGGFSSRGPQMKIQGGHALKHAKFLDIELRSTGGDRIEDESETKIGKKIRWVILKAKAGSHEGYTGDYDYLFETCQINWAKDAFEAGLVSGVIKRNGSAYYEWEGQTYHGEDSILAVFKDPAKRDLMRKQAMEARKIAYLVGK
jgi:RecA/RadA recombinase